ncbi:hypothetical protein Pmar_PMAR028017 [Perkinsus marinus ATCC 50983]|uniref:Uncharacterized protein n=1 Tax=Perkinsus marinus (strain ATCC 50983 / TXsc) TaxID=423536 RepID=C5LVB6_PERM5|nr:hypothetical protein Pmar_PMAR028017 [Perkinsus marinus ATCC 50983]EEQ99354.1 hypothetical protein Pmar_PMAR028017 [Perkinsus marinus ATCC 50983]|eukprot:XP_002766637.1 hypothetical protein Pmar_PMAR028017 [Perkinsus marinus ATCC 50983]
MQIFASIFIVATLASGEIDWSKITLEPAMTPTPTGLDLSGIVLDGPGTTPAAVGIDLSGYTLEPPETNTPAAGDLDWSSVSPEGTTSPTTVAPESDTPKAAEDSPAGTVCAASTGWPAELVGVLIAISVLGLIANCVQLYFLKKVMSRTLAREEVDIEMGDRYRIQEGTEASVKEVGVDL